MDTIKILKKYAPSQKAFEIIYLHSKAVAEKALAVAKAYKKRGKIDEKFIFEGAMLHDLGVFFTNVGLFDCNGKEPYIRHGVVGGKVLRSLGYLRHARVLERHIGVGITKKEILERNLPLPKKDFIPRTLEERIISYADNFFTKSDVKNLVKEKKVSEILKNLEKFGKDKVKKFLEWHQDFLVK